MRIAGGILLTIFAIAFLLASPICPQIPKNKETPTLTYSQLFENKGEYLGKLVRVRATYIYGFEWAFLCDKECAKRRTDTWVEFLSEDELCRSSKHRLKHGRTKYFDNRADVVFVGRLTAGSYGRFGAYAYHVQV